MNIKKLLGLILIPLLLMLMLSCSSQKSRESSVLNDLIGETDSLSFDELKTLVITQASQASGMLSFFSAFDVDYDVREGDILEQERFSLDAPYTLDHILDHVEIIQAVNYPGSRLKVRGLDSNMEFWVEKIYYKNNKTESDINDSFSNDYYDLKDLQIIDSISLRIIYTYPTSQSIIELSSKNSKEKLTNGEVKLTKIDGNKVDYVIDNTLDEYFIRSQAMMKDGRIIGSRSSLSGDYPADKSARYYKKVVDELEKLSKNVADDKYETKEELLIEIEKVASRIEPEESDKQYYRDFFSADVESLLLYFAEDMKTEEFSVTLPVKSEIKKYNIFEDNGLSGIVDETGNIIVEPKYDVLSPFNAYYYYTYDDISDSSHLLHLNTTDRTLDTLSYSTSSAEPLTDDLIKVSKDDLYGALGSEGKLVIPIQYEGLYSKIYEEETPFLMAATKTGHILLDMTGKKMYGTFLRYGRYNDGWLLVQKYLGNNDWGYCFVNKDGKEIDFTQYSEVGEYEDGMICVKKGDYYGYVRIDKSIAIPFMYDAAKDFFKGIALVGKDGQYGLINTRNEEVVPMVDSNGYSYSSGGGEATYNFGGKSYNEKGQLIEEDEES